MLLCSLFWDVKLYSRKGGDIMIDNFIALAGDLTGVNKDLVAVLASVFLLFLLSEFCRFLELMVDFVFRRKR